MKSQFDEIIKMSEEIKVNGNVTAGVETPEVKANSAEHINSVVVTKE